MTMIYMLSTELSKRENYLVGSIVSQWGFLENDIFEQTLMSFKNSDGLPASMNNAQFSVVLQLWLERVVDGQSDDRRTVLIAQHREITRLSEYRQAIVHSRWEWHPGALDKIIAVRVHKKSIKRFHLTVDGLAEISTRLGQVRYWLRYPGGSADQAAELSAAGGHISRLGFDLLFGWVGLDDRARPNEPAQEFDE